MFRKAGRFITQGRHAWNAMKRFSNDAKPASKQGKAGSGQKGPVSWLSLGLVTVVASGLGLFYAAEKERLVVNPAQASKVVTTGKPAVGGPFVLVNQDGVPVTDATYRGDYLLLYFGFTHCPDICPNELVKIQKVMAELEKRKSTPVKPVFITCDPARDSVRQMKNYSQDFGKEFSFLTGTPEQIGKVAKAYRVYFSKVDEKEVEPEEEEEYLVDHSIVMYFVGPDGNFLEFFTQRMQVSEMVDKIISHTSQKQK